jgi:hypothetical protein
MSLTPLDNPLERLGVLPNAMNWRGGWSATEQYYLNDVVVAPSNNGSYILNGKTALIDGGDPALNIDWQELSSQTTGVNNVAAGVGISLTGTPTNVIVNNNGVITATAGAGITVGGTAQNPIITNSGVVSVVAGAGIGATLGSNPTISNTGVLTVTGGGGIAVTAGQNPSISNTGVNTLTAGTGITLSGTAQNPIITNTGSAAILSSMATTQTIFGDANPIPDEAYVFFRIEYPAPPATNAFVDPWANSGGFLPGTWLLNLNGITFTAPTGVMPPSPVILFGFTADIGPGPIFEPVGGVTYNVPPQDGSLEPSSNGGPNQYSFSCPQILVNQQTVFAACVTKPIYFFVWNRTGVPITLCATPTIFCEYFPNGPQ